jgi:hypothetical protein
MNRTDFFRLDQSAQWEAWEALAARLAGLEECVRAAIKAGDWKVDGACDPDAYLTADSASAEAYEDEELARMLKQEAKAHSATAEPKP